MQLSHLTVSSWIELQVFDRSRTFAEFKKNRMTVVFDILFMN